MSFAKRLLSDSAVSAVGAALTRLWIFLLGVWLSRNTDAAAEFGLFSTVLVATQFVGMIVSLGVAQTAAQGIARLSRDHQQQRQVVQGFCLLAVLLAAIVFGLEPLVGSLSTAWLGATGGTWIARLAALQVLAGAVEGVLRGLRQFSTIALAPVLGIITSALVMHLGAASFRSAVLALAAFLVGQLAVALFSLRKGLWPFRPSMRQTLRIVSSVGIPNTLNGVAWNSAMLVPPLWLASTSGGLTAVALWNATSQVRTLVAFLPVVIVNTAIPHLTAQHADVVRPLQSGERGKRNAVILALITLVAGGVPCLGIVVFSRQVLMLFRSEFAEHTLLATLAAVLMLVQVTGTAFYGVMVSRGLASVAIAPNVLWALVVILATPAAYASFDLVGLAGLYIATYIPVVLFFAATALRPGKRAQVASSPAHSPSP